MAAHQGNPIRFSVLLLLTVLAACDPATTPQETVDLDNTTPGLDTDGYRPLLGHDGFAGWHGYGGLDASTRWQVENGVIIRNVPGIDRVDLVSDESFGNFELQLEWKISAGGNSGIMFNVTETPEYNKPWLTGPEIQILDDAEHSDSEVLSHQAGALYDLVPASTRASVSPGQWNESRLLVNDGMVRHWLNGTLVVEVQMWDQNWNELVAASKFSSMPGFGKYFSGHIALQDHGDVVAFRNIRIREL